MQELIHGLSCVENLEHPFVLISCSEFMESPLEQLRGLHEGVRNVGHLVFLDTIQAINQFKKQGKLVLFFSYQWLSWDIAGPDVIQHNAMRNAMWHLRALWNVDVAWADVHLWLDILSISQSNLTQKCLAVTSLYSQVHVAT